MLSEKELERIEAFKASRRALNVDTLHDLDNELKKLGLPEAVRNEVYGDTYAMMSAMETVEEIFIKYNDALIDVFEKFEATEQTEEVIVNRHVYPLMALLSWHRHRCPHVTDLESLFACPEGNHHDKRKE